MSNTPLPLGTFGILGPEGSDTQKVTKYYLENLLLGHGEIIMFDVLEKGINALVEGDLDQFIISSLHPQLNSVFFHHFGKIEIIDAFIAESHEIVLARNPKSKHEYKKITTGPSFQAFINCSSEIPKGLECIISESNITAARLCALGKTDLALTNENAAKIHNLEVLKNFGPIKMSWTVLMKKDI